MTTSSGYKGVRVYRRLLSYVVPYWKGFTAAAITMIIFASTDAALAALMQPLVDGSFVEKDPLLIKLVPALIIAISFVRGVAGFVSNYGINWVGRCTIRDLRKEMFAHMLYMPTCRYDRSSSGHLLSTLTYNTDQVSQAATNAITVLIKDTFTAVFLLGLMFYVSWILTLAFLVVGPIVAFIVVRISDRFRRLSHRIQASVGNITHVAEEGIEGHRVIKIFAGQEYEAGHFRRANENNRQQVLKMEASKAAGVSIVEFIAAVGLAGVVYLATHQSIQDTISPGTFVSFMTALILLHKPIRRLMTVNAYIQRGIAAAQSIFELLDAEREKDTGTIRIARVAGEVEYRRVSFRYEHGAGDVLHGVDMHIKAGQTAAFVGKSGSGKSTLISLLPRFYDTDRGAILLDGTDIHELSLGCLREQIALVSQHVTLFNDTIRNNIAYGSLSDATDTDILRVAEMAHAREYIDRMPDGLDTLVGENGVLLSGGQRQRLAIARALLKDAPILILDEATSALDTESERYIQSALNSLMENRTTLVVAHRLSTIENADVIYVLHDGRIVESGTHSGLLARNGYYAKVYELQLSTAGRPPAGGVRSGA